MLFRSQYLPDEGFWFGLGVFETIRVHKQPLFWEQHIARLNTGLSALDIRPAVHAVDLLSWVKANDIHDCVLKIAVTPDCVAFQTRPIPDENPDYLVLPVEDTRSRNPLILGHKSMNYLDNVLARRQATENGYDDVLFLGPDDVLSETCRANLFFEKDGQLFTPDQSCGLLPGIIRQWVMEHYPVKTGIFTLNDLLAADAVFVTNSVLGIRPITRIGGTTVPLSTHVLEMRRVYQSEITAFDD